jgi:hypothetical protein
MRRYVACGLIVMGLYVMMMASILHAQATTGRGWLAMCNTEKPYTPSRVRNIIECATDRWGGDEGKIIYMGSCESGLDENESSNSPYVGVFQYHPDTWESAASRLWHPEWGARHVDVPSIRNGRAQVLVTVRFVTTSGYGPWDDGRCA